MLGNPALVLNDPTLIEEVLNSRRMEFEKGSVSEEIKPATTHHALFIAKQSEDWADKRRADPFEQPWFGDWLAAQVGPMQAAVAQSVEALVGAPIELTPVLRRMTFDAFAVASVGEKLPDSVFEGWSVRS